MELNQLEQFVTIVKCGTISKAAEELFISQPALSFSTALSIKQFGNADGVIVLPVLDESAKIDFYCRVLKKNKPLLREFLERHA